MPLDLPIPSNIKERNAVVSGWATDLTQTYEKSIAGDAKVEATYAHFKEELKSFYTIISPTDPQEERGFVNPQIELTPYYQRFNEYLNKGHFIAAPYLLELLNYLEPFHYDLKNAPLDMLFIFSEIVTHRDLLTINRERLKLIDLCIQQKWMSLEVGYKVLMFSYNLLPTDFDFVKQIRLTLPIKDSKAAFVRIPPPANQLFYVEKDKFTDLNLSAEKLKAFDEKFKPSKRIKSLGRRGLKNVISITGFTPPTIYIDPNYADLESMLRQGLENLEKIHATNTPPSVVKLNADDKSAASAPAASAPAASAPAQSLMLLARVAVGDFKSPLTEHSVFNGNTAVKKEQPVASENFAASERRSNLKTRPQ